MTIRIHDWQRMYRTSARYMGREVWAYIDYARRPVRR